MSRRDHHTGPEASLDVPGLCGALLIGVLPLVAWFVLQGQPALRLTEDAWAAGCWYRLWTGHLLHYGFEHFAWDGLMFVVFAGLLWKEERWRLWLWLFGTAPLISLAVFWVHPSLSEYRGLSALDTMLFLRYFMGSLCVLSGWQRWVFAVLPLLGLIAKIVFEYQSGVALFVGDLGPGVVPLPSAHLVGALLGLLWSASVCQKKCPCLLKRVF